MVENENMVFDGFKWQKNKPEAIYFTSLNHKKVFKNVLSFKGDSYLLIGVLKLAFIIAVNVYFHRKLGFIDSVKICSLSIVIL
jgi:hypothetical protein